jgi:hypothetical protein
VRLDPRWHQVVGNFVQLGFRDLIGRVDVLLFLACLVMPFRRIRPLVAVAAAFTVAHSITLAASTYSLAPDALWFPPLIETLIALSVLYMALENIVAPQHTRWMIAFLFGLSYGFGFSFPLRDALQFAGSHLPASLVSFNIGIELGQLFALIVLVPVLAALFRFLVSERLGIVILSVFVAHTSWHWLAERYAVLRQFRFQWPVVDAAFLAMAMRWAMLAVILTGAYWLISNLQAKALPQRTRTRTDGTEFL